MTSKSVLTNTLQYAMRITIVSDEYMDGSKYIGLYTSDGEPYSDITTNLGFVPFTFGFVQVNSESERFVNEHGIGKPTETFKTSGFNTYRLYEFNI